MTTDTSVDPCTFLSLSDLDSLCDEEDTTVDVQRFCESQRWAEREDEIPTRVAPRPHVVAPRRARPYRNF